MEQLKLKHLAPYLPYGLKWYDNEEPKSVVGEMTGIKQYQNLLNVQIKLIGGQTGLYNLYDYKPILRPLSDLTAEHSGNFYYINDLKGFIRDIKNQKIEVSAWIYLLQNHFDVYSLIDDGLAIDKNTL